MDYYFPIVFTLCTLFMFASGHRGITYGKVTTRFYISIKFYTYIIVYIYSHVKVAEGVLYWVDEKTYLPILQHYTYYMTDICYFIYVSSWFEQIAHSIDHERQKIWYNVVALFGAAFISPIMLCINIFEWNYFVEYMNLFLFYIFTTLPIIPFVWMTDGMMTCRRDYTMAVTTLIYLLSSAVPHFNIYITLSIEMVRIASLLC